MSVEKVPKTSELSTVLFTDASQIVSIVLWHLRPSHTVCRGTPLIVEFSELQWVASFTQGGDLG